jgi:hypothetical protein
MADGAERTKMPNLLTIDPGIRGCGVAFFTNQHMRLAAYVKNPVKTGDDMEAILTMAYAVNEWSFGDIIHCVVVEFPQVYGVGQQKGDQKDLLALAALDGAICSLVTSNYVAATAIRRLPREWKGQTPGDVMCQRIEGHLSSEEMLRIQKCPASLRHNVLDAIGIGLHHLGRLPLYRGG